MRYSLANYILSVESNDSFIKQLFGTISIGGEGSYLNRISLSLNKEQFSTKGFVTGGWVHDKSLDRTGVATVELNQLSDKVSKFIQLCKCFYSGDYDGFTLTLSDINGNKVATCVDCYISKPADQDFAESSGSQVWQFTCGQINYN